MKKFIVAVLALLALQMIASPTPEEMYGSLDKDGKYRQMQEQVDQMIQKSEEAARDKAAKQQVALWVALAIGYGSPSLSALYRFALSASKCSQNALGTKTQVAHVRH